MSVTRDLVNAVKSDACELYTRSPVTHVSVKHHNGPRPKTSYVNEATIERGDLHRNRSIEPKDCIMPAAQHLQVNTLETLLFVRESPVGTIRS